MALQTVDKIIDELLESGWNPRIEFAMHGEPTLHPKYQKWIRRFRQRLPKKTHIMITSNGAGLLSSPTENIDELLESVNVLALDEYEGIKIVANLKKGYKGIHEFLAYPDNVKANPHKRRRPNEHVLVVVRDIAKATKGNHSLLNNHCGCAAPPNESMANMRCAKPFREMSIRWDGSVALCCNDWRGVYKCGNIHTASIENIWNNKYFRTARIRLYAKQRDFKPCLGCDAVSYRLGLLPDKYGQKSMIPPNDARDFVVIDAALAGESYTEPVKRSWER